MKKWSIIAAIMIMCLCLTTGCQQEKEPEVLETYSEVDDLRQQVKEEGIFYIDGYKQQMTFYDFKLSESIPLCDKPNCEHDSGECNAYLQYGYQSTMGCYRDKIYFFDITDPEIPFYQADKNGANRKVFTTLSQPEKYVGCFLYSKMIFAEDSAYLLASYTKVLDEPMVQEDGTIQSMSEELQIIKIDLETGAFETIKKFETESGVVLQSFADGKLIYSDSGMVYVVNIETKECEMLNDKGCLDVDRENGTMYYSEEENGTSYVYAMDIETKEKELVFQKGMEEGKVLEWSLVENKLYYCSYLKGEVPENGENGVYLLDEQKDMILTKEQYKYRPLKETSEWYITYTEEGLVCISKEAYENQEWDKVQVIGWI